MFLHPIVNENKIETGNTTETTTTIFEIKPTLLNVHKMMAKFEWDCMCSFDRAV